MTRYQQEKERINFLLDAYYFQILTSDEALEHEASCVQGPFLRTHMRHRLDDKELARNIYFTLTRMTPQQVWKNYLKIWTKVFLDSFGNYIKQIAGKRGYFCW